MHADAFRTRSLQDERLMRILQAAIDGVNPESLTSQALRHTPLPHHNRVFILALGKAAEPMVRAAVEEIADYTGALAITKKVSPARVPDRVGIMEAGHPVPDARSVAAGEAIIRFCAQARQDDLLICLISGGGSALAVAPVEGVSLDDLQGLTAAALASGASIDEINVLRRQLDRIKGGGLSRIARSPILALILSDVIGDRLESIASGPTTPNPTGGREAGAILVRYHIQTSPSVRAAIAADTAAATPGHMDRVRNIVIGNNSLARHAAVDQAQLEGLAAEALDTEFVGEAREVGMTLAAKLSERAASTPRPTCIVAGGESTVTLRGSGKGGRNQELALAAVDALNGKAHCFLIALGTDGNDGPTDAAGAVVTGVTAHEGSALGMLAADYLDRNDSYSYFDALGDLLKPGYTGTNVNDLVLLAAL